MADRDRLSLVLVRIEEFLALVKPEDFGEAELAKRVFDDLHFLHQALASGRATLPLPKDETRPLDYACLREGHLEQPPFNEKQDRAIDLLRLFHTPRWPLLPWQAAPSLRGDGVLDEAGLMALYATLRDALIGRQLDTLMGHLAPALRATALALGEPEDFELQGERRWLTAGMEPAGYRPDAPEPAQVQIRPLFDGCRVRLLNKAGDRHALAAWLGGKARPMLYPIQCQFGRTDGKWAVVGWA